MSWYFTVWLNLVVHFVSILCSSGHTVLIRRNSSNSHLHVIKKNDELQERHREHMLFISAAHTGVFFFLACELLSKVQVWPRSSLPLRCRADRVAACKWLIPARLWERQLPPYFSKIQKAVLDSRANRRTRHARVKAARFFRLPTLVKLLGTVVSPSRWLPVPLPELIDGSESIGADKRSRIQKVCMFDQYWLLLQEGRPCSPRFCSTKATLKPHKHSFLQMSSLSFNEPRFPNNL